MSFIPVTLNYAEVDLLVKELTRVQRELNRMGEEDPQNRLGIASCEGTLLPLIALLDDYRTKALIP